MGMLVLNDPVGSYVRIPALKQALLKSLEQPLSYYGLEPVDFEPAGVRGVRVGGGLTAFTPTHWFLAMVVRIPGPAPVEGLDLELYSEVSVLAETYVPPRMRAGRLEEPLLIPPNTTVYSTPPASVLEGMRVVVRPAKPEGGAGGTF